MTRPILAGVVGQYDERGADLSPCGLYRFRLWRRWAPVGDRVNFVMLNPSTADVIADDPTIRRCVGFAKAWGYSALSVTTLFALRATDPQVMLRHAAPIGPGNDTWILDEARAAALVVCAWGGSAGPRGRLRAGNVLGLLRSGGARTHFLRLTKDGDPCHPLYLPALLKPVQWERVGV